MRLIDKHEIIVRKIIEQCGRHTARSPSRKHTRIVFNSLANADLPKHLNIVFGALFYALSLYKLAVFSKPFRPVFGLFFEFAEGRFKAFVRYNIVRSRINRNMRYGADDLAGDRGKFAYSFDLVAEKFNPYRLVVPERRKYLDDIPSYTEFVTYKINVVSLILNIGQLADDRVTRYMWAAPGV